MDIPVVIFWASCCKITYIIVRSLVCYHAGQTTDLQTLNYVYYDESKLSGQCKSSKFVRLHAKLAVY